MSPSHILDRSPADAEQPGTPDEADLRLSDLRIRDPYVLADAISGTYFLYGTTDQEPWSGPGVGFDAYRSSDLEHWSGPIEVFRPPAGFWGTTQFWAPEMHRYAGRYFMFATFAGPVRRRGTQALVADRPDGPFLPWSDGPVTPDGWESLDGTLHVDPDGVPWLVFCHEWLQIGDGSIAVLRRSDELTRAVGEPIVLFHASEARWARPVTPTGKLRHRWPVRGQGCRHRRAGHAVVQPRRCGVCTGPRTVLGRHPRAVATWRSTAMGARWRSRDAVHHTRRPAHARSAPTQRHPEGARRAP